MNKKKSKKLFKKLWYFIWEDNSIWSWIANIILAFVLIKFIVYPGLGFILDTTHPVVAVVSSSMEHKSVPKEFKYELCGNTHDEGTYFNLDDYWTECGNWYETNTDIVKNTFSTFSFKNGFNKGDIMVLFGTEIENIEVGDVIVFRSNRKDPIIHRVVKKNQNNNGIYLQTKGDNNRGSIKINDLDETNINENIIIGKAILRIPLLGYIKIGFVELLRFIDA